MPQLQARPNAQVAAVFPPWWSRDAVFNAVSQSGVAIVSAGVTPNILIVSSDNMNALGRLYKSGAWSLITTNGLADCFAFLPEQGA